MGILFWENTIFSWNKILIKLNEKCFFIKRKMIIKFFFIAKIKNWDENIAFV